MRSLILTLCTICLFITGCTQSPQEFPSKPIKIIVPWDVGGGTDQLARMMAKKASDVFGTSVQVFNKPGGAGTVGHLEGMKARPDGYTVTMITFELCTYKGMNNVDIDHNDFRLLLQVNEDPGAITVQSDSQWQNIKDYVQYAKENPGQITVGNSGPGAVWHLGAVRLEQIAEIDLSHIPLDGAGPAVTRLTGGHLDSVAVSPAEVLQHVQEGELHCLAIMSEKRYEQMPEVPTFKEEGIQLVHGTWRGLAVPKATPDEIAQKLEAGFTTVYEDPEFQQSVKKAMMGLKYREAEAFQQFLNKEAEEITQLIESLGISSNQ